MIFFVTCGLIALGRCVNVEVIERVAFDPIRMLMTTPIIAPEAKQDIRPRHQIAKDY